MAEADRPRYHAALAHGANHLVTLATQAMRTLESIGIEEPGKVLGPLLNAALDGTLRGGERALTGPVMRGDVSTVQTHALELAKMGGEEASLSDISAGYRAMARITVQRALATGKITVDTAQRLLDGLNVEDPTGSEGNET